MQLVKTALAILTLALVTNITFAADETPPQKGELELKNFIKGYVKAFNEENSEKVEACFHFPHSSLNQDQEFTVVENKSELGLEAFWQLIKTNFDWKANQISQIKVYAATEEKAMVKLEMEGINQSGNAFTVATGFLGLSKVNGQWGFSQVSWYFSPKN